MTNQKISTLLGTIILVIIAVTVFSFVWVYEKNQYIDEQISYQISTPKKNHVNLPIKPAETLKKAAISHFENNIYTNTKYYFQVILPEDWTYKEFDRDSDPVIIFYKNSPDNPLNNANGASHFTQGTFVLIAPGGISAEGIPGITLPSNIKFSEKIKTSLDYPLASGSIWATITNFENYPSGAWNESGFLFGSNTISEKQTICTQKGQEIDLPQCNYYEDAITYRGTINAMERKQIEAILSSFKFLLIPIIDTSKIRDMILCGKTYKTYSVGLHDIDIIQRIATLSNQKLNSDFCKNTLNNSVDEILNVKIKQQPDGLDFVPGDYYMTMSSTFKISANKIYILGGFDGSPTYYGSVK